ncbi:MAG: hypothetical protein HQL63_09015 [Magnetococcales bacterium]|nr:hypothetical protein [Magnetococcales bacterium]MBF0322979.1 hypothetical protein [Magnetococcales bacterium]
MLPIAVDAEVEEQLKAVADGLHKPVAECLHDAILQYIEDRQDYLSAAKAIARQEPAITLDELEKRLGLDG